MKTDWNGGRVSRNDGHRLWPLPRLPWVMKQTWNDLLFAHYPIKLGKLRRLVPDALPLDSFDGVGWIGVTPFRVTGMRLRGIPPLPGIKQFPELNVRTYVKVDGKPGVYFFSLDAANLLAVGGARMFYRLPYRHADMGVERWVDTVAYESRRRKGKDARLVCRYRPISDPYFAQIGSFEDWATERYCLYTIGLKGKPVRCDILHTSWPLQDAEADFEENTMCISQGIEVDSQQPILHYAKSREVSIWPLVPAIENQTGKDGGERRNGTLLG